MTSILEQLGLWYRDQCNGDWEHQYGIRIETLDNPGWRIKIDLIDTELADRAFDEQKDQYEHPDRWLRCWKEDATFHAACGPERLEDAVREFLRWAQRAIPLPGAG